MSVAEWVFGRLVVVIVGTATVAAIGAGTVGVIVGRHLSDDSNEASASASPATSAPSPALTSSPTVAVSPTAGSSPAPTGSSPIGAPTRVNALGVPVGYPHTEAGAISACGNYFTAYNTPSNRAPNKILEFFKSIASPSSAERLADGILEVDKENASTLGVPSIQDAAVSFTARPLGYRVESSSESDAKILIWTAISFGTYDASDPDKQAQTRWGSDVCQVHWEENDWKLLNADDGPDGPLMTSKTADDFKNFVTAGGPTA